MKGKELAGFNRVKQLAEVRALPKVSDRKIGETNLVRSWIEKKQLESEPDLQGMCWLEYSYMTPLERTELFTHEYEKAYLAAYAKAFPDEDVTKKRPINPVFAANDPGVMNAMWKARAYADAAGVPYDLFFKVVMDGLLVNDKWQRPPRPNQLYGKLTLPRLQDVAASEECTKRFLAAHWDQRFFAASYRGDEVQETVLRYIKSDVAGASDPAVMLSEYLCVRKAITVQRAKELFGEELVLAARALSDEASVEQAEPMVRYIPGCLGFPDTDDGSACQVCPVRRECLGFDRKVRDDMINAFGTDDPRRQWKRDVNKNRQRRFRERQKNADWQGLVDDAGQKPVNGMKPDISPK